MKLAILTDLHANREAVQTCLAQARAAGVDRFAFLGDYVGYGADPAWVVDQVRSLVEHEGAVAVLGNHDNATAREPSATMDPEAADASQWTRSQLDASQLKFLGSLPLSATLGHCLFVHANAWAPAEWGYIHSRGDAVRSLQATDRLYTFCGHVHEPRLYHMSATAKVLDFQPVPGVAVPLLPTRRWLVIPGSAGQSRDANPAVCWASFDTESLELVLHRVPYDFDTAAAKVLAAGLPPRWAERLRTGV